MGQTTMVAVARLAALALCGIIFLLTFDSSAAMTATSKPSECKALRNFRKTTLDSVHGGEQFKKKDVVRTGGQGLETTVGALIVNEEFKIAFCPIQKVASSEWGKFFNRLVRAPTLRTLPSPSAPITTYPHPPPHTHHP